MASWSVLLPLYGRESVMAGPYAQLRVTRPCSGSPWKPAMKTGILEFYGIFHGKERQEGSPPSLDSLDLVEGRIRCSDDGKLSIEIVFHAPIALDRRDSTGAACVTSVVI